MNALVCTQPGQFEYQSVAVPELTNGNAIIKIKRIGVCGTDYHGFQGQQPFFEYPRIMGHEMAGELIDIDGSVAGDFHIGEAVTFVPYFNCGYCVACRTGHPNCCVRIKVCGVHRDGGMTEYISVPADKLVHGNGLSFDELALVEPLSIAAHGIKRARVSTGEFVLIVGAGPIGLAAMEFARIAGVNVIALDVNERRLDFCRNKSGITHVINALQVDVMQELSSITNGDMPVVVIDATGNLAAINNSFKYLAHSGRYVLIGLQKEEISFSHPEFHKREAQLMSSRNALKADFEYVISCVKNGSVHADDYITHRTSFENAANEFPVWLDPRAGVIKAIIEM